jgi:hypothetical protein
MGAGYTPGFLLTGLLSSLDEFGDSPSALAAELRIAFATELRLTRLSALATKLGVATRSKLRLPRLATFSAELRVTIRAQLPFSRLPSAAADLSVERRAVLPGGGRATPLAGLPDGDLSSWIHRVKRRGTALACLSIMK